MSQTTIFIDTNIFMYAIGHDHPFKQPAEKLVTEITEGEIAAAVNTEVLQEILYRYTAIGKAKLGFDLFDAVLHSVHLVWPVTKEDALEAKRLQVIYGVKTRDAIHAATMKHHDVSKLYSYDADFDRIPGLKRLQPQFPISK